MDVALGKAKSFLDSRVLHRVIQFVAVVALLIGLGVGYKQNAFANCLAAYNDAYSVTAGQRTDSNQASLDAIDTFIRAVVSDSSLPQDKQAAAFGQQYQMYIKARAAADEERKLNPLPAPPKERC